MFHVKSSDGDSFNIGDILQIGACPFGFRVLTVGDEATPNVVWVFNGDKLVKVQPSDLVSKLTDIRFDKLSCTLNEWPRFNLEAKQGRIKAAMLSSKDYTWRADCYSALVDQMKVFDLVVSEVCKLLSIGIRQYSIRTILEYLRHTSASESVELKINNNLAPDIARLTMVLFPEMGNFFNVRKNERRHVA